MYIPLNPYHQLETVSYVVMGAAVISYVLNKAYRNRKFHIAGTVLYTCAILIAIGFHIQDFHHVMGSLTLQMFLQHSGSLLLALCIMLLFDIWILWTGNRNKVAERKKKRLWLIICAFSIICGWYHTISFQMIGDIDVMLQLSFVSSLETFHSFALGYFIFITGDYTGVGKQS